MPYILPLLHPASFEYSKRNAPKEPAQVTYLKRVARHLKDGTVPEIVDYSEPPKGGVIFPTMTDLDGFRLGLGKLSKPCVAYDIENAGNFLLCIGMWAVDLEDWSVHQGICLPFKLQGGKEYWEKETDHLAAVKWLYDLLADEGIASAFHNGVTHDVPMLEGWGFEVRGRMLDTMVIAHYTYPEMPKGLAYLSTLYLGAGVWKDLVKEDEKDDG
jgi:hypothetical protein